MHTDCVFVSPSAVLMPYLSSLMVLGLSVQVMISTYIHLAGNGEVPPIQLPNEPTASDPANPVHEAPAPAAEDPLSVPSTNPPSGLPISESLSLPNQASAPDTPVMSTLAPNEGEDDAGATDASSDLSWTEAERLEAHALCTVLELEYEEELNARMDWEPSN